MTIWNLLTQAANQDPDAPALLAPGRMPLTYAALRTQTSATVAALRAAGISQQDKVALVLPNGPDMASAALAVASGAICAPLNPGYGAEEFRFYLDDLDARALLLPAGYDGPARTVAVERGVACLELRWDPTGPAGCFALGAASGSSPIAGADSDRSTCLFDEPAALARGPVPLDDGPAALVDEPAALADDIALVLHTSGTTSRPKIVPLSHANLCSSARNIARTLQLSPQDRCLNIMPLFHIHGLVAALLATMASGGSVACTPGYRDGRFLAWLAEFNPTWTTAVPSMYPAILAELAGRPAGGFTHRLRFVRSSSAPLSSVVMREIEVALGVPMIEAYGMTEAAHQMASNPLPPAARKPGSVGIAAGPAVAVMNETGQLLPTGATGEIVIRGDNVTRSYENNPEANAKAFTAGWFRTGDQGHIDDEGYVFLSGRLKEIINRGGEQVSPLEVDEALMEHPGVAQAVAFSVRHETLGEDVAAAVVLKAGAAASAEQIRASLFGRLAEFKIPSQLVILTAIPKGATGKIQRIGLAAKLAEQLKPAFVAPRDATETAVAAIFAEVLGTSAAIGAFDNFFALGGDSLRGFQALARIRNRLHADLSILDLFKEPTAAQLAARIEGTRAPVDSLEALLAEVEAISDAEAVLLLRRLQDGANGKTG